MAFAVDHAQRWRPKVSHFVFFCTIVPTHQISLDRENLNHYKFTIHLFLQKSTNLRIDFDVTAQKIATEYQI